MASLMDDTEMRHLVGTVISDLGGVCSFGSIKSKGERIPFYKIGVRVRDRFLGIPFVGKKEVGYVGFNPVFVKSSGDPHSKYAGMFVHSVSFLFEPEVKAVFGRLEKALGEKLTYVSSIGEIGYGNGQFGFFNPGCIPLS